MEAFLNASNDGRKNLSASVSAGWLFTTANHFARKENSEKIDFVAADAGIQIYSPISENDRSTSPLENIAAFVNDLDHLTAASDAI